MSRRESVPAGRPMTGEEAAAYIQDQGWSATRLGLDRTRELMARLGDPQRGLNFLHVAGSNGKGSVSAMLASVLRAAGCRVGLYTSPHLVDFRERIQVDGVPISPEELGAVTTLVREAAQAMADHPSQFELSTAVALVHFARAGCEAVVLEVGMGGALDSTNVIDPPQVALITNIGLEHTAFLGSTVEEIAATKAGIVKPGSICVCYDAGPAATGVVRQVCAARGAQFRLVDFGRVTPLTHSLEGQTFRWDGRGLALPLLGPHQLRNAATALTALEALGEKGWSIPWGAVEAGLGQVVWPARCQVLRPEPLLLLDGAHNPQCVEALAQTLEEVCPGTRFTLVTGVLSDKNWRAMMERMLPFAREFLCLTPDSPRAVQAETLAEYLRDRLGARASPCKDLAQAMVLAEKTGGPTLIFGSLYLAGEVLARWGSPSGPPQGLI